MKGIGGTIIKACREQMGVTQRDLSKRTGVARSTLANYEACYNEPPYDRFVDILHALGFEVVIQKRREKWKGK